MKKIIHFEEDGELDVLVDCDGKAACSFLVPWKWLGDSLAHESVDDEDAEGDLRCNMLGECYGRVTGTLLNGKIHGTVLLWHYRFNHGVCHHKITTDGVLVWEAAGGDDKTKQKVPCQKNWVCVMEFKQGKVIGKPKIYAVIMKKYRCRSIWRVFFSSLPMGRNSLKSCAQWWGGEGYVPVIVEWS